MKVRAIDKDHDWLIGHKTQSEAIAQNVKTAILCLYNDWFLDPQSGIKWFNYLAKNPNLNALKSDIKSVVLGISGVVSLNSLEISLNDRGAVINLNYTDIYGIKSEIKEYANN